MKSTNQFSYKYRGISYEKNRPQKCLINLFQNKINQYDRTEENKTLVYRGITYQVKQPKTIANLTTSVRVHKYRGTSYLTCIADFLSPSDHIAKSSLDNRFGDIDLIKH